MSSIPFRLGIKVVDEFKYNPSFDGEECAFVMRGKDEKDVIRKLEKVLEDVPQNMELLIYHIGFRPDKPVPVARYFIEAEIGNSRESVLSLWHGGWQGRKPITEQGEG